VEFQDGLVLPGGSLEPNVDPPALQYAVCSIARQRSWF